MYLKKKSVFIGVIFLIFCSFYSRFIWAEGVKNMTFVLTSVDISHRGEIPHTFTCDGNDISPALNWLGMPGLTKSLVLIVDDPDAPDPSKPKMTWVHWLLYNISPSITELSRGIAEKKLPIGTQQGKNDWKQTGYSGPCPPIGKHRYFFKLYALDIELPDLHSPNKTELEKAISGHVIEQTELIGTYQRH